MVAILTYMSNLPNLVLFPLSRILVALLTVLERFGDFTISWWDCVKLWFSSVHWRDSNIVCGPVEGYRFTRKQSWCSLYTCGILRQRYLDCPLLLLSYIFLAQDWCVLALQGTTYVYGTFFRPYISQHENEIDRNLLELRARATDVVVLYFQKAASVGQNTFFDVLKYVAAQSPSQKSRQRPHQVRMEFSITFFCQKNPLNQLMFSVHHHI